MRKCLFSIVLLTSLFACTPQAPSGPVFPPIPYFIYTVRHDGEPLALIAKWYTGASENARALISHNPQLNPTSALSVGDVIRIPDIMLITRRSIPEEVFAKLRGRPAKRPGADKVAVPTARPNARSTVKPSTGTATAKEKAKAKPVPTAAPNAIQQNKLDVFDDRSDEDSPVSGAATAAAVSTKSEPTAAPANIAPTSIALDSQEQKIFENSLKNAKPTASKSTYEQMQEMLAK